MGYFAVSQVYASNDSYISSIEDDREEVVSNLVLIPNPMPATLGSDFRQNYVFNSTLHREITQRYRETVGYTTAELLLSNPVYANEYTPISDTRSLSIDNQNRNRDFGQFVMRRAGEYHLENYFKSDEDLRSVWELKEQISNYEFKVSEYFNVKTNYSFSGNYFTTELQNSFLPSRVVVEMNKASFGPSTIDEILTSVSKGITESVNFSSYYRWYRQVWQTSFSKGLTPNLGTSATVTYAFKDQPEIQARDNSLILGLNYIY